MTRSALLLARTCGPRSAVLLAAFALASACGVQPVELGGSLRGPGPDRPPPAPDVASDVSPTAIAQLRAAGEVPGMALDLLYPAPPALVVPADLAPISFEWRAPGAPPAPPGMMPTPPGMAAPAPPAEMMGMPMPAEMDKGKGKPAENTGPLTFELRVSGARSELRLYTLASSGAFQVARWHDLLRDHAGSTVQVRLRAVREATGELFAAKTLDIEVRPALPAGMIYAWSTTAQGIARARIDATHEWYDTAAAPVGEGGTRRCVGCHRPARDGRRIVAAIGGEASLWSESRVSDTGQRITLGGGAQQGRTFAAFDPTGSRLVVTRAGRLAILDADTGVSLQDVAWPMASVLAYPDWSPDGRAISLVYSADPAQGPAADSGELGRVPVALDGSLGALERLPSGPGGKDERVLFPSYSPDGEWLVFERRKGPMRDPRESSLWLVAANGGEAVELKEASAGKPGAGAPSFIPGDVPGRAYVLFSSGRAVGSFQPAEGQRQLFVAALDLPRAAAGMDPSHPAFWLPAQQRGSSYVQAHWGPAVRACEPSPEICDGADDDCDEIVDEDCCTPAQDLCGDQQDSDCDGLVDEGCDCQLREQCDNGVDDDCDLSLDEQPCAAPEP